MKKENFVNTTPAGNGENYRDSAHIPQENEYVAEIKQGVVDGKSKTLAKWVRNKQWGVDVREALALLIEWLSVRWYFSQKEIANNSKRQQEVEKKQTELNDRFSMVLTNVSKDSEVIDARNSVEYGEFATLHDRLAFYDKVVSTYEPKGFEITIKHSLNRMPHVLAIAYEYAFGTEPAGFDTGPAGTFGGTNYISVPVQVKYANLNELTVCLPAVLHDDHVAVVHSPTQLETDWYVMTQNKTIQITLVS